MNRIPTKLNALYDRLNADEVPRELLLKLRELAAVMEQGRLDIAQPQRPSLLVSLSLN